MLRKLYFRPGFPIGKARRLSWIEKIFGRRNILVRTIPGFLFSCDQRDWLQRNLLCNRVHELEVTTLLEAKLRASDIFFDIGANAGYFSALALACGVSRVIAFEPDPDTCNVMRRQFAINDWDPSRWRIAQLGLSDREGYQDLIRGSDAGESGFGDWPYREVVGRLRVKVGSLNDFCCRYEIRPTVIKIDVEGWEFPVLNGADKILNAPETRLIIFEAEITPTGQIKDNRLSAIFKKNGFTVTHIPRPSGTLKVTENFCAIREQS